jgi:hypothetical protein
MLKWIKRLFFLILFVVAIVIGIVFTMENGTPLAIVVFGIPLPELAVGLWIVVALLTGAILGLLISFLPLVFSRHANSAKDKKILRLQEELNNLRISGLKR